MSQYAKGLTRVGSRWCSRQELERLRREAAEDGPEADERLRRAEQRCGLRGIDRKRYLAAEKNLASQGILSERKKAAFGRKNVTTAIADAWFRGKAKRISNTETDGETIWLFDNAIAWWSSPDTFTITTADYPTATTKERLNGLPGVRVHQYKGELYLNNKRWDGSPVDIKLQL